MRIVGHISAGNDKNPKVEDLLFKVHWQPREGDNLIAETEVPRADILKQCPHLLALYYEKHIKFSIMNGSQTNLNHS